MMDALDPRYAKLVEEFREFQRAPRPSLDGEIWLPGDDPDADMELFGSLFQLWDDLDSIVGQIVYERRLPRHLARWRPAIDEQIPRLLDAAEGRDDEGRESLVHWRACLSACVRLVGACREFLSEDGVS